MANLEITVQGLDGCVQRLDTFFDVSLYLCNFAVEI
jgi:hypothetical protein